jgi:hypothetical protein
MAAIVKHPTTNPETSIQNDGFCPDLSVGDFMRAYRIDDRVPQETLLTLIQNNTLVINTDRKFADWVCQQTNKGYLSLGDVPAQQLGDTSAHLINYRTAVFARVKADILLEFGDQTLTSDGESEYANRAAQAAHYINESITALRRILGKSGIRVRRITAKPNGERE